MNSKYIVRQPIKDAENRIIGYEIQYYGENQAFSGGDGPGASDFAAADTIYNFLTLNTDKLLREFYDLYHYSADEKDPQAV